MEFALILRELSRRRQALAIGAAVAFVVAILSVYHLDGLTLKPRRLKYSSAATTVFVDTPSSVLGNLTQNFEPLQARATAYANFMASPTVLDLIGRQVGIPGDQIYAAGPLDPSVPRIVEEPTAVQRNVEITGETTPYRLNFNNDPNLPTIGIYAQAPTTKQSIALADAAAASLAQYVSSIQSTNNTPPQSRVVIRQLGQASGGVVDGGISKALAIMVFVGVFLLWCVLMLASVRFRAYWRASASFEEATEPEVDRQSTNGKAPAREKTPPRGKASDRGSMPARGKAPAHAAHVADQAKGGAMRARARPSGP
jgi:hypothetical protein